ncbi:SDR family oxidoreductase [Dyella silvatica]|uniref:SDR family oxidoreductase n=1 Tax=Dyella silvatica TaxID=2992128 RepID=UPI002258EBBB|nr:SDR family oxidoreductase [Dyella silvatica]
MNTVSNVALVTGSARGIGRAIAERLAQQGVAVLVHAGHALADAEEVAASIRAAGGRAAAMAADLTDPTQITQVFDATEAAFGVPNIVVANAGVFVGGPAMDTELEAYDYAFAVNTRATFLVLREGARRMADGGRMVAISTNLTKTGRAGTAVYAATKAAVEQLVHGFARELGPRGITVNAVSPGPTDTRMISGAVRENAPLQSPLGRLGEPRDIADIVAFLASDEARWLTGQVIHASGGIAM